MVDPTTDNKHHKDKDRKSGKGDQQVTEIVNFTKVKRFEECRVCAVLEQDGKTGGLYDNHSNNFVTGCPSFHAMTVDERRDVCIRAKLCLKCTDPKVVHSQKHRNECKVGKKSKLWYTCSQHPTCLTHFCLCSYHKKENQPKMEEFSKKRNL